MRVQARSERSERVGGGGAGTGGTLLATEHTSNESLADHHNCPSYVPQNISQFRSNGIDLSSSWRVRVLRPI